MVCYTPYKNLKILQPPPLTLLQFLIILPLVMTIGNYQWSVKYVKAEKA